MTLDGQLIFNIVLVVAGGAISLLITMLRDEIKAVKQSQKDLSDRVYSHETAMPKEYIRKEDMHRLMDEVTTRLASIEMDIKQLLKNSGPQQH